LFYNTPPWAIAATAYASSKNPFGKPSGKTVLGEKSTYEPHFVLHMLLRQKPYVRKLQVKTHKGEKRVHVDGEIPST
jgi:hypothetical protein